MREIIQKGFNMRQDTQDEVFSTYETTLVGASTGLFVAYILTETLSEVPLSEGLIFSSVIVSELIFLLRYRMKLGRIRIDE